MSRIVARVQTLALALGAPGLFIVAFLDSSFLSLPEINDILLVWMVVKRPSMLAVYATCATLGSLAGCLVMYSLGRKGGDVFVRRRFHAGTVDRALATFQRYGVMAVLIPSLLPPPAPFKIFVVLAGAAGISPARFVTAVLMGRGIRYFGEGFLALRYGDQTLTFLHENGRTASLVMVGTLVAGLVGYLLWTKAKAGKRR